jgi:putative effector of murein hydrolase
MALLWLANVDYNQYFSNVQAVHLLLGPATVALAVLLVHHHKMRQAAWA